MTDQDTSSTPNDTEPVYALLLTNEATTVLPVDPTQPIQEQVSNAVPDAVDGLLVPPNRDLQLQRFAYAGDPMIILTLEHARPLELRVNYRAWWLVSGDPVLGPAVVFQDRHHADPTEISPLACLFLKHSFDNGDHLAHRMMEATLDAPQFAGWAHLR